MICAAVAAPRKANDLPCLRAMLAVTPSGSGRMLANAQYGVENHSAIRDSGRCPITDPPSGHAVGKFNDRAEMLGFLKEHP